jgi:hypothetical protein
MSGRSATGSRAPEGGIHEVKDEHVRAVRAGHGANCSSIGSVIDTLFATATVGAAVFAAVLAALQREGVKVAAPRDRSPEPEARSPEPEAPKEPT